MRFKRKRRSKPRTGDPRIVTRFALLPITVKHDSGWIETRWLEFVTIKQVYVWNKSINWCLWKNVDFLD